METSITKRVATLEHWYAQYREPIARHIARMLLNRDLVEDVTQETFVRAWHALKQASEIDHVQAYLYRIATNLCVDLARRRQVICWQPLSTDDHLAGCVAPDPQEVYVTMEPQRVALSRLPFRQRAALVLVAQGYSYRETAARLHLAPGGMKMFIARARHALFQSLQEVNDDLIAIRANPAKIS